MTTITFGKAKGNASKKIKVRRSTASQIRQSLKLKPADNYKIHKLLVEKASS